MGKQSLLFCCCFLLLIFAISALRDGNGDGSNNNNNNNNNKKRPWSEEEDAKLLDIVNKNGPGNWDRVAVDCGVDRSGKSCRFRFVNYLQPGLKKQGITAEEEAEICSLYQIHGSKWAEIAKNLPGRTDNEIKNFWNKRMKYPRRRRNASNHCLNDFIGHTNATIDNDESFPITLPREASNSWSFSYSSSPFGNGPASYSNEHERGEMIADANYLNWHQSSEIGSHIDSGFSSDNRFTNRSMPHIQQNVIGFQHQPTWTFASSTPIPEASSSQNEPHERERLFTATNDPNCFQSSENASHLDSQVSSAYSFTNRSVPQIQQNFVGFEPQHALTTYDSGSWPLGSGPFLYFNEQRGRDVMHANPPDPNWHQSFGLIEGRHVDPGFPSGTEVNGEAQNSRSIQTKSHTKYQNSRYNHQ